MDTINLWEAFHKTKKPDTIKGMRINAQAPSENYILDFNRNVTSVNPLHTQVILDGVSLPIVTSLNFTMRCNQQLSNEGEVTYLMSYNDRERYPLLSDNKRHELRIQHDDSMYVVSNVYGTGYRLIKQAFNTRTVNESFFFDRVDLHRAIS